MIRRTSRAIGAQEEPEEDINPMENIANVSDVMLVLAVGIMLALVMHWNVDIAHTIALDESQLEPVDAEIAEEGEQTQSGGNRKYQEVGKVYKDVTTGDMYVMGN